jgi:hypothetical protein
MPGPTLEKISRPSPSDSCQVLAVVYHRDSEPYKRHQHVIDDSVEERSRRRGGWSNACLFPRDYLGLTWLGARSAEHRQIKMPDDGASLAERADDRFLVAGGLTSPSG